MINPELERRYADCSELVDAWRLFLDLVNRAVKAPDQISPSMEQDFLSAKARIAMLFDSFLDSLKHDRSTGSNMLGIVNRAITLKIITKSSQAEAKKLEIEWHEVYLLLNETVSQLEEERVRLQGVNEMMWRMGRARERAVVQAKGIVRSFYFKVAVGILAVIFIIFGIPLFGIYDYDDLRDKSWAKSTVGLYLKAGRNMGFAMPYINLKSFKDTLQSTEVHAVGYEDLPDVRREQVLFALQDAMPNFRASDGKTLQELFAPAAEFGAFRFTGNQEGYAFIFWFRNSSDAVQADMAYQANFSMVPDDYTFIRKSNTITILRAAPTSDGKKHIDQIRANFFTPLP